MSATFMCGAEVPMRSNEMLLSFQEDRDSASYWHSEVHEAFRYSFVPDYDEADQSEFASLLSRLNLTWKSTVHWTVGWQNDDSGTRKVRCRYLASALAHKGWSVGVLGNVGLASRSLFSVVESIRPPHDTGRELQGFFAIVGNDHSLSDLLTKPCLPSIRNFCQTQRMEPSLPFVMELLKRDLAIAYMSVASDVRRGLVLLGPRSMAPSLAELKNSKVVSKVYRDEEADRVWS